MTVPLALAQVVANAGIPGDMVTAVAFSADTRRLVVGTLKGSIR